MFNFLKSTHNKFFNFTTMIDTKAFSSLPSLKLVHNSNKLKHQEQKDETTLLSLLSETENLKDEKSLLSEKKLNNFDEENYISSSDALQNTASLHQNFTIVEDINIDDKNENTSTHNSYKEAYAVPIEETVTFSETEAMTIFNLRHHPQNYIVSNGVPQEYIKLNDFTDVDILLIKDLIVAARTGYMDYSVLKTFGYVDCDGYVKDSDALYDSWLLQAGFWGLMGSGSNFSDKEIDWGKENFEIIRVLEANNGLFEYPYEVNLSLLQDKDNGDYIISLAGSTSSWPADWFTNLGNVFSIITPHYEKEAELIDLLFEEDIEPNATVNLVGYSLGGHEAMLQYYRTPDLYEDVYAIQPHALGGLNGMIYNEFFWDDTGDEKITAIISDEDGFDFNDMAIKSGHIPAGTVYDITVNDGNNDGFFDNFIESHTLADAWNAFA